MKSIKTDSDEQKQVVMRKINRGDTAELATKNVARFFRNKWMGDTLICRPGVTHPSDATANMISDTILKSFFSLNVM